MAEELLIFGHVIEGLVRSIARQATPRLEARLREVGLDVKAKVASAYRFDVWCRILQICRDELYGTLPPSEGYQKLGEGFATAYFETTFGAAVIGVTKLLGPVRTLKRATQNFRSANNFTETRCQELGHNDWELRMNRADDRDFTAGIIRMLMLVAGAKNVAVARSAGQGEEAIFRVTWN